MWLEHSKLILAPFETKPSGDEFIVTSGSAKIKMNALRHSYFNYLAQNHSPYELVNHYLKQGKLVRFTEVYGLMQSLVENRVLLNPEWQQFLSMNTGSTSHGQGLSLALKKNAGQLPDPETLRKLGFFRGLNTELQNLFIQNASMHKVPEGTKLCQTGELSRDMFVLLDGTVGVFKNNGNNQRQLLSSVSIGATVGEGGFLLGKPRTADIIALSPATLAVIHHNDQFEGIIEAGKAEPLQRRFWVLNGLLASPIFSKLPNETIDSLVFAGKMREFKNQSVIVQEGAPGNSFFIVVQGAVNFYKGDKLLRTAGQGGTFGEVALMVSGGLRTATAQAIKDCLLVEIEQREFYEFLANHLHLAKILEEMAWARYETVQDHE